jgi:hypothetical protein
MKILILLLLSLIWVVVMLLCSFCTKDFSTKGMPVHISRCPVRKARRAENVAAAAAASALEVAAAAAVSHDDPMEDVQPTVSKLHSFHNSQFF